MSVIVVVNVLSCLSRNLSLELIVAMLVISLSKSIIVITCCLSLQIDLQNRLLILFLIREGVAVVLVRGRWGAVVVAIGTCRKAMNGTALNMRRNE